MSNIIFDAPSANWSTASETTAHARVVLPIMQTSWAYIYEVDYVVNVSNFQALVLDQSLKETTLSAGLGISETTQAEVVSVAGFPSSGRLQIGTEIIEYTGIDTSNNYFTGLTRGAVEGVIDTDPASHSISATVYAAVWLIEQTSPEQQEGELVRYTVRYATIPDTWYDYEMRPYQFPGYYNDTAETNYRAPLKEVGLWQVIHYYERANQSQVLADIEVPAQAFEIKDTDGNILEYVDDASTPTYASYASDVAAGTYLVASDSVMERYAGNVWVTKKFLMKSL